MIKSINVCKALAPDCIPCNFVETSTDLIDSHVVIIVYRDRQR